MKHMHHYSNTPGFKNFLRESRLSSRINKVLSYLGYFKAEWDVRGESTCRGPMGWLRGRTPVQDRLSIYRERVMCCCEDVSILIFSLLSRTCPRQLRVLVAAERKSPRSKVHPISLCLSLHANDVTPSDSVPVWAQINQMHLMLFKCTEE